MKIRKAKIDDIEKTIEISKITWIDTYPNKDFWITRQDILNHFLQKEKEWRLEKRKKEFRENDKNRIFLVWEVDEKVVAFCDLKKNYWENNENILIAIYVLPEFQGKWIWKKLFEEIFKNFTKNENLFLEVASYNKKAIKFYEKFLFKIIKWSEDKHFIWERKFIPTIKMKKVF